MLISLHWLRRYVDLDAPAHDIAAALTALGFEVEAWHERGAGVRGVVATEVRRCEAHPEADRLRLCRVFDGVEEFSVVCGAPNVAAGQKVLFARVGAELPGGIIIKPAKLRGRESFGMLCAEDELGLGPAHDGIVVLPPDTRPGTPLAEIPGLCDATFEINVTPNRPDALGHLGVARELAARFAKPLRYPDLAVAETGKPIAERVDLRVEDESACPHYVGRVIEDVHVGPSPDWLVQALASVGKKSINNVVDLTNFALLEWGQPTHAFDLDRLQGRRIVVRRARDGETLTTLDGVSRRCDARDLVVADAENPQVLAGVMGGESSGVTENTRQVFLETAYFEPRTVRGQARRHALHSDSSYRFERGVDPLATARVCDTLAARIAEVCGGRVAPGRVEARAPGHPVGPRAVSLRPARVEKLLGLAFPADRITALLASIEIRGVDRGAETLRFEVPGFRGDLEREVDLIEEVARLSDYNSLPALLPSFPLRPAPLPAGEETAAALRRALRDLGCCEAVTLRFTSPRALERLRLTADDPRRDAVALRNPISEEWSLLPTTPLPALLQALEHNQNTQERDLGLFEIGRAFFRRAKTGARDAGVREEAVLGLALMGRWDGVGDGTSSGTTSPVEFARLKGLVENLLDLLRVTARWQYGAQAGFLHPRESAALYAPAADRPFAELGLLHPKVQADYGLRQPVAVAEIRLEALGPRRPRQFAPYSLHTAVVRDLNVVVAEAVRHADVLSALPPDRPQLETVRLNSVYRGQGLPAGHKALHYSFLYRHSDRSLTDEEVNALHERLKAELLKNPAIQIK